MKNKLIKIQITILSALLLSSCGGGGGGGAEPTNNLTSNASQTPEPFNWELATPEDLGVNSMKLQEAIDYAMSDGSLTQSIVIVKGGKIIGQGHRGMTTNEANALSAGLTSTSAEEILNWYENRDQNSLSTSWSTAKSFTSVLVGIAIDQGLISSVNESASNYLTEWQGDNRSSITIKNLLDMRSTLVPTCGDSSSATLYPCTSWAGNGGVMVYSDDQLSACLEAEVAQGSTQPWYYWDWQPGYFYYSNCDTQLLGEIIFRATGLDPYTYADTHLFSKLNMSALWWRDNSQSGQANGNYLTYCCLDATTSDFAKFGLMILNGGELAEQRIVSSNYIDMIKNISSTSNVESWLGDYSYGLKFWTIRPASVVDSSGGQVLFPSANTLYSTIGFDGQYIVVDFENDMVIARNSFYQPIENNNSQRKMKLLINNIDQSSWVATVPGGLGAQYSPPSGNSFSIQQLLLKVNESLN